MEKNLYLCMVDKDSLLYIGKRVISLDDDSSFPLLFQLPMGFASLSERSFKHKCIDVIVAIKFSLSVNSFLLSKVRRNMSYLNVSIPGFKLICFNL